MSRQRLALLITLWGALFLSACASRRIRAENALALAAADARVLEGCYDCLVDARATYERLATSRHADADTVALRLFETQLLLAVREKELALDGTRSMARAAALAKRAPAGVNPMRLLAIADAILPDRTGRPADWPAPMRRARATFVPKIPGEIAWLEADAVLRPVVRRYLALALDCSYDARVLAPTRQPGAAHRRPVLAPDSPPAIIYRTGICMSPDANMLAAALALVPEFHEAAYFAGVVAAFAAEEDGGVKASALFVQARRRFPRVIGLSFMSGWLAKTVGECTDAVGHFDRTLEMDAVHEYALLERTICLSRLHRDTAAVASATRLIALAAGSTQPAYYWRAVSRLRLRELADARSDIEAAKAIERDANVLTIAGVIENEQNDLAIAEQDLRAARALPRGDENCTAAWTLALVMGKGNRPADAAQMFENAMTCYDVKVADIRFMIARLRARPPTNPAYLAKRIAALEADSTAQRTRYFASAFNAAGQIANAGRLARALELLDVAARDPALASPVAQLREAIVAIR